LNNLNNQLKIHSYSDSKSNEFAIKQNLLNKSNKIKKEYLDEIKKVSLNMFELIASLHKIIVNYGYLYTK
jgi:phage tail tape-measure protein